MRERETLTWTDCLTFDLGADPSWSRRGKQALLALADTGCDVCFPGTRERERKSGLLKYRRYHLFLIYGSLDCLHEGRLFD